MRKHGIVAGVIIVVLVAVLVGMGLSPGRSLPAAIGETLPQPAVWLALVSNAPTPTGTPTPTATPSPTPTRSKPCSPARP